MYIEDTSSVDYTFTIINSDYNINNNNISTIFTQHPY